MRASVWGLGLTMSAALAAQPVAAATVIGFDAFDPLSSLSTYTESGFVLTLVSGSFQIGLGDPGPGLGNTGTASLDLTYDSPARYFSLVHFTLGNESFKGPASFTISGFLDQTAVYTANYTLSGSTYLQYLKGPQPTTFVDRVRIVTSGYHPFLDNLVLDPFVPMPVPEASTWALMIAGLGAVGAAMRRRGTSRTSGTIRVSRA